MATVLTIQLTREQALQANLLVCKCGHPWNNHFDFDDRPCAHCPPHAPCKSYRERARVGKILTL